MTTIPWDSPLGVMILLAWFASPVIAFSIAFFGERWVCKKHIRGWVRVLPVLAGCVASLPAVWFMFMLQNMQLTLLVLGGGIAVSLVGGVFAYLIYRKK